MLNERIEKYSEIADSKGLFFVWQSICHGVKSVDSLTQLRAHHFGKLCLNIHPTLWLLEEMGFISINEDDIEVNLLMKDYNEEDFFGYFSDLFFEFLLNEDVLSVESLRYSIQEDCFVLARNCIRYRYASYRNLLLSLGILVKRDDGTFAFDKKMESIIDLAPSKNKKKSEERLLQELEQQRQEGFAGESFVLHYEQNRLKGHSFLNKIKQISIIDVTAGFDIISFDDVSSKILDRFIEVKTFRGKPHFHWSANEIRISKIRSKHYYLYLVDYERIKEPNYAPTIIQNPSMFFIDNEDWNITPDSYLYEHI